VEFDICFDFLELRLDGLGAVFGASKVDERFVSFFRAVLFEEPAWTERSAVFDERESKI